MSTPVPGPEHTQARSRRRPTRVVRVGHVPIGGDHPIVIQSMTIADTMDTEAVLQEIRALVDAGCPIVRLTAPSLNEAENLRVIKRRLREDGIEVPLVADIHYTPNAALRAAEIVEKVRINPGNFADRKRFAVFEISDADYQAELERVRERFVPLVRTCREHGCAMRIGTNHGSLSDRIMNRYGDTPLGMVESALEFVRICEAEGYRDIILSMKSSVTSVMIAAYRLLVQRMDELGMDYPLHLGVTEAGDGLAARIKSTIGIGALLVDGLGDTIRVSLAEDSVHEIPAARAILDAVARERPPEAPAEGYSVERTARLRTEPSRPRRESRPWMLGVRPLVLGGSEPVRVEARALPAPAGAFQVPRGTDEHPVELVSVALVHGRDPGGLARLRSEAGDAPLLVEIPLDRSGVPELDQLAERADAIGLALDPTSPDWTARVRTAAASMARARRPVRFRLRSHESLAREVSAICAAQGLQSFGFVAQPGPDRIGRTRVLAEATRETGAVLFLEAPPEGADAALVPGALLSDGLGDVLCLSAEFARPAGSIPWPTSDRVWREDPIESAYQILQGCRLRLTRAEFIACPSCGRTQFDLQTTTARIQARTRHLKGVKIAIMGCIVNGPGEMADADFGYVGSGSGRIDLYVGKERVAQKIDESEAEDRLVALIREHGRWTDPAAGPPLVSRPSCP